MQQRFREEKTSVEGVQRTLSKSSIVEDVALFTKIKDDVAAVLASHQLTPLQAYNVLSEMLMELVRHELRGEMS